MAAHASPGPVGELSARIGLEEADLAAWKEVAEGLVDNFDPETGLFEQHRGYFDLEYIDLQDLELRTKSVDAIWAGPGSRNHRSSSRPTW